MCRFLILRSRNLINPYPVIESFSKMAKKSKALDGDWQGDGWGICWLDRNNHWCTYKSILPIWEERGKFDLFPETNFLVIHARSASFPETKGIIKFNQPFTDGQYVFVFNGFLKGVKIPYKMEGEIGSEKIWFLIKNFLRYMKPEIALEKLKNIIIKHTEKINALNVGLCDRNNIYALTMFNENPDYYQLKYFESRDLTIVSSEEIENYKFEDLLKGKIIKF